MEQLFGSKTRVKLLKLFSSNPNTSFYVREITRKIDEQINSVRRELANLLNIGILTSKTKDNKLYYEVNQKFEHYQALRMIFAGAPVASDSGEVSAPIIDKDLKSTLRELGAVELLAYMGGFTQEETTGVDVLVVGDVNRTKVHNFMADLEEEEGRELNYSVMSLDEFKYRRDVNDRFITLVDSAKKTVKYDPNYLMTKKPTKAKGKK